MTEHADETGPRRRRPAEEGRVLIIGARRHLRGLAGCLDQAPWSSLPVVGYVDRSGRGRQLAVHPRSEPVPVLGRIDRLAELVDRSRATHLMVALSGRPADRLVAKLAGLFGGASSEVQVHWVTDAPPRRIAPRPHAGRVPHRHPWPFRGARLAKRLSDFLLAATALVILSPLFLVVALAILLTDGRPIFYTQERIGQGGRPFRIWKFRSMRRDAEGATGPIWATDHDARCTRVGDWLRTTNIDELPQLWNILTGELSIVGPRPERPNFVEQFRAEVPDYDLRHAVPCGLTGWAQVHGWRGRTSLRKRLQYDLDYIRRWSFWLDFRIMFMTIQHIAFRKTTWGEPAARRKAS